MNSHGITLARIAKHEEEAKSMVHDISDKAANTAAAAALMDKFDTLENRIKSFDGWAGEVAWNTDPESVWKEMSGKDEWIKKSNGSSR